MGVSIGWQKTVGKTHWITPGSRSQMHSIMLDAGLYGVLTMDDLPALEYAAAAAGDGSMGDAFRELIAALTKHKSILAVYEF